MTRCDSVWDLLSLYADGEATSVERDLVERHIARCESCAVDLQFLREAASVLARTPLVSPPPDLKQAILASTVLRPTWQERLSKGFGWALAPRRLQLAGSLAALAVIGTFLYRGIDSATLDERPHADAVAPLTPPIASGPRRDDEAVGIVRSDRRSRSNVPGTVGGEFTERAASDGHDSAVSAIVARNTARPHTAPPIITAAPRRQGFRMSPETRLAIAAPRAVEELALNEPSPILDAPVSTGTGDSLVGKTSPEPDPSAPKELADPPRPAKAPSYVLTASVGGGAETMGSFANLRAALRKQKHLARTASMDSFAADRRVTLGIHSPF